MNPGLAATARANAKKLARSPEEPFEVIVGDASRPVLSDEAPTVLYVYNSFGDAIVERLLDHLQAHVLTHPDQKLWLVYYNPVHAKLVDARSEIFQAGLPP